MLTVVDPTETSPTRPTAAIPYAPFPLTEAIHRSAKRFRVLCCGRRFGKSTFGLVELLLILKDAVTAGEPDPRGMVIAPTFGKVEEDWRIANALFRAIITDRDESKMSLVLGALGQVDFRSADAQGGAARGGGYNGALLDEDAYIPDAVWESDIRPALSDRLGRALFLSTPNGQNGFARLYQMGQEHPDYQSWRYSTWEGWQSRFAQDPQRLRQMAQEWEDIQRTTSERTFQQEYLADFLTNEGQLWDVDKCARGMLRGPLPGRHYVAGLDVAHVEDWMVTAVLEVESQQLVGLARSRHRSWALQKSLAAQVLAQYPQVHVLIDSTGLGDPIAQDLRASGLDVEDIVFTHRRKHELVENLSVGLDHGYLGLPKEPQTQWLLDELKAYREWKTHSGVIQYGAPEGLHDDGVTALMLAAWGVRWNWQRSAQAPDSPPLAPGVMRAEDWLTHSQRVAQWRRKFPTRRPPESPFALSWSLLNTRRW